MELRIFLNRVCKIRGTKVMLDYDLAEMYDVSLKSLMRAVWRNIDRFPPDLMFRLTIDEFNDLKMKPGWRCVKRRSKRIPYVFPEQGGTMVAALLKSQVAIQTSITIVRAFVAMQGGQIWNYEEL